MLEALVRISLPPTDSKIKSQGDIVCVKLAGAVWGTRELKEFQLIKLDDPVLEAQLLAMTDEPSPVITLPYAERDVKGVVTVFSSKVLDVSKVKADTKTEWSDTTKDNLILESKDAVLKVKTAEEKPLKV